MCFDSVFVAKSGAKIGIFFEYAKYLRPFFIVLSSFI